MMLRVVVSMLIAAALLVDRSTASTVAHAQAGQPTLGGQNAGQSGVAPQLPTRGGVQPGVGAPPPRLPGQNCRGLGACAWGNQSEYTATCTADARVCTSTSTDPDWSGTRCSAVGALRTCSSNNGGLIIPTPLPGTTNTGIAPNGQPGTGPGGTGSTSTLPGLCANC
jgi:hypothetical protein